MAMWFRAAGGMKIGFCNRLFVNNPRMYLAPQRRKWRRRWRRRRRRRRRRKLKVSKRKTQLAKQRHEDNCQLNDNYNLREKI